MCPQIGHTFCAVKWECSSLSLALDFFQCSGKWCQKAESQSYPTPVQDQTGSIIIPQTRILTFSAPSWCTSAGWPFCRPCWLVFDMHAASFALYATNTACFKDVPRKWHSPVARYPNEQAGCLYPSGSAAAGDVAAVVCSLRPAQQQQQLQVDELLGPLRPPLLGTGR